MRGRCSARGCYGKSNFDSVKSVPSVVKNPCLCEADVRSGGRPNFGFNQWLISCRSRFPVWLPALLLVAVTVLAYQPAWHGNLIWDDAPHIARPELHSFSGLVRTWIKPGATQQYYPLVYSVFWVEHRLWGDSTLGYHLVNILLHTVSALLLLKILQQLGVPGAWLAASIFALHPVQVESVAWIAERKNTLSGVFYLGSALAYLSFDRTRTRRFYALALGLFVLGLFSKTVIATLPAALLLVFWWKRGRLSWKPDVYPLAPFFVVGMGGGLFTAWVERKFGGAEGAAYDFSVVERCLIAGRALWFYAWKLVCPVKLTFIYPRWEVSSWIWWQWLFPAAGLLVVVAAWAITRPGRGLLAGLLFYGGTLFPALGFFNVYPFRYSFVADHFQYLASVGVITLVSAGAALLLDRWRIWGRAAGHLFCVALLATLAVLTWQQSKMYADMETLWRTTIAKNPACWMAHINLGTTLDRKGQTDEAIRQYREAIRLRPDDAEAYYNLGIVLAEKGQTEGAIRQYQKAIRLRPDDAGAHYNLGIVLAGKGQTDGAIRQYQEAIRLKLDDAKAHNNLGIVLAEKGQIDDAISQFREAIRFKPDYAEAHNNLDNALGMKGQIDDAISQFREVLRLKPDDAEARNNLGDALFKKGQTDEAICQYQEAIRLRPDDAVVHYNLGIAFVRKGRIDEAIGQYQEAIRLKPDYPEAHNNLGTALGRKGRIDDAILQFQEAIRLKPDYPEAHNNLGTALGIKGRTNAAIK